MSGLTRKQKQDYAKQLYIKEDGINQKEIAKRTGVTEKTLSRWINAHDRQWEKEKKLLKNTKGHQLTSLISQLDALKHDIEGREKKWPTAAEADTISKLTKAIESLETHDTSLSEKMDMGMDFLRFVRKTADFDLSNDIARIFDLYIKSLM